jgi:hypothetical protein
MSKRLTRAAFVYAMGSPTIKHDRIPPICHRPVDQGLAFSIPNPDSNLCGLAGLSLCLLQPVTQPRRNRHVLFGPVCSNQEPVHAVNARDGQTNP